MFSIRAVRRLAATLSVLLAAVFGVALVSPVGAAAHGRTATPMTWHVLVGQESRNGAIQGMAFLPDEIWINVGDTVHWTANSMEIHTVSFFNDANPPAPFDPSIGYMVTPTPETSISAPGQFRNSGVMTTMSDPSGPPSPTSYDLRFTGPGTYEYICYVHGQMMMGSVHVRAAGTPYPHTQRFYDTIAHLSSAMIIAHGFALRAEALAHSSSHRVFVGAADKTALVMRFIRTRVHVRVGDTVTFDWGRNGDEPVPHTVTFGPEVGSPFQPVGDPTNYRGGSLNLAPLNLHGGPTTQTVRFTRAGTYHYLCMFHDTMGMVGTVVVR